MPKIDILSKISNFGYFSRWHPEVALRYLPLVKQIDMMGKDINILEVGSGGLGIVPYLNKKVTGVDVEFNPPFHPLLKRVKASVDDLPFADSSFDIVLSADMLEHLSNNQRIKAVGEMLRVTRHRLLLAVPCGRQAQDQDAVLDQLYRKKYGKSYHYLSEQLANGLPETEDICHMILNNAKKLNKKIKIEVYGNENLQLRLFLMKGWLSANVLINIIYRKILLIAIPLFYRMNSEPVYRRLFFVNILYENRH